MSLIPCQRDQFDIPEDVAYFNCAYMGPSARRVSAAGAAGVHTKATPWALKIPDFFEPADRVRALFAQLIGAHASDIAVIPSVSYGIGTAAANLPLRPGSHVLVLEEQFPSNVYPWKAAAEAQGATIRTVARPKEGGWTRAVRSHMNEKTAVVALPHCHWTDGSLVNLEEIGEACRSQGIPLVVDATQSLGAMPFDVAKIKPAFVVAAAYKWLLGPYSVGYLYAAPEHQGGRPLEQNWITRAGSEDFAGLVRYTDNLALGAVRYDMGERSNFALMPMAAEALSMILEWGVPHIAETLGAYNAGIAEAAAALGFRLPERAETAPHLMGLRFPGGRVPEGLPEKLASAGIYVSVRGSAMRIAPHLYNHEQDKSRLINIITSLL